MNNGLQAKRTQTFSALGQTLCVAVHLNQVFKPGTARREQLVAEAAVVRRVVLLAARSAASHR